MHKYQKRPPKGKGLTCRKCGGWRFVTYYTRKRRDCILRSRQCKTCGERMITWEQPAAE